MTALLLDADPDAVPVRDASTVMLVRDCASPDMRSLSPIASSTSCSASRLVTRPGTAATAAQPITMYSHDPALPGPGGVGVWSKADAQCTLGGLWVDTGFHKVLHHVGNQFFLHVLGGGTGKLCAYDG